MRKLALLVGIAACHHPAASAPVAAPKPAPVVRASAPVASKPAPAPAPVDKHECSPAVTKLVALADIRAEVEREHCDGDAFDPGSHASALILAVERGQADAVSYLLSVGADPSYYPPLDELNNEGETALYLAVKEVRPDLVGLLLDAGADPNSGPPGTDLLTDASWVDSAEIGKLLVEHGFDTAHTDVMRRGGGPGADLFVYLADHGVATDDLPADQVDSLRWEAAHEPSADAPTSDWVAFWIDVVGKTRSPRARDLAIRHLGKLGAAAASAVPALIDVLLGKDLAKADWSRVDVSDALSAIGWTPELDAALPRLLRALRAPAWQQIHGGLIYLLAKAAPPSKRVVDALLAEMKRGAEPGIAALGLGILLPRADAATQRRITKALERAAKSHDPQRAAGAQTALQALRSRSQT